MKISTKEVGAQRIDDSGMVAAVLPEDSGTDGLEGLVSLIGVPCGKLEPKVSAREFLRKIFCCKMFNT